MILVFCKAAFFIYFRNTEIFEKGLLKHFVIKYIILKLPIAFFDFIISVKSFLLSIPGF